MSYTKKLMMVSIMILLATITVGGVYASTVTVSGGQISLAGDQITVPVVMDVANNGLIYYQMRVTVADPTIAQVTAVSFPSWAGLHVIATTLPASEVVVTAGDLHQNPNDFLNPPGATNVPIATVTLKGLKAGSTPINLEFVGQGLGATTFYPTIQAGTLQVGGGVPTTTTVVPTTTTVVPTTTTVVPTTTTVVPTTTTVVPTTTTVVPTTTTVVPTTTTVVPTTTTVVPTTTTVVPTTTTVVPTTTTVVPTTTTVVPTTTTVVPTTTTIVPTTTPTPYTGPTGQVYFSTTPQSAHIVLDGTTSGAVTPIIMTLPTGSHGVVLKMAGYDELQANFEVKTNAMTTVSRRLSPGNSVVPTTPGTTVVTTIPTTTITQVTTVPTIVPTTASGAWSYKMIFPSWLQKILPFNWG